MSYDFYAPNAACDHLILLERYTVSLTDHRTLKYVHNTGSNFNMRAPINGASMMRMYIKGVLVNPDDPVYGYQVVPDPDRVQTNYVFAKVVFNQPLRNVNSLIEITYITRQGFCTKCNGAGSMVDWLVGQNGSILHVNRTRKLAQQTIKYILTSVNPFTPSLTCPVRTYVGRKLDNSVTTQDISAAVTQILSSYQSIQAAQKTVQTLEPAEILQDVESVDTTEDPTDPTLIYLAVEILAFGSSDPIPLSVTLQQSNY